ncbi:MAG: DUF4124 domain-containing protein [Gammaproteobacteria bacterium]|nr:DUF4124 domain-containing protein [Gammaproteobacteria bacterium]
MSPKRKRHELAVMVVLLMIVTSPASAKLYKWVDEDGNVFYSDKIPPEQSTKRHQLLDDRGIVRENVRRAKTPEELAEERRQKELQAERDRIERAQAVRDQILLETFPTERDLIIARDDRLASVDSAITLASKTLEELRSKYDVLDSKLKSLQAERQPIPGNLAIDHRRVSGQVNAHSRALASRQEERDNIVAQFEADLIRYRELRALRQ